MFNIKRGCRFLLYIIKSLFYSPEVLESLAVCCGGAGTERPGPSWVLWGEAPGAMGQVEGGVPNPGPLCSTPDPQFFGCLLKNSSNPDICSAPGGTRPEPLGGSSVPGDPGVMLGPRLAKELSPEPGSDPVGLAKTTPGR